MSSPVVVAVARDPAEAAIWVDALRHDGIDAATFQRGPSAALGGLAAGVFIDYPVLVDPARVVAARNVVAELGGADRLSAIATHDEESRGWRTYILPAIVLTLGVSVIAMMQILGN